MKWGVTFCLQNLQAERFVKVNWFSGKIGSNHAQIPIEHEICPQVLIQFSHTSPSEGENRDDERSSEEEHDEEQRSSGEEEGEAGRLLH